MSDDLKDAIRLLFECADQLRLHDERPMHMTSKALKDKMRAFLDRMELRGGADSESSSTARSG